MVDNYKDGELLSWNCQTFGQKLVNPISVMFMKRICPTAAIDLEPAADMENVFSARLFPNLQV